MDSAPDVREGGRIAGPVSWGTLTRLAWAVGVLALLAGVWLGRPTGPPGASGVGSEAAIFMPGDTVAAITVHVSGWVLEPGLVALPGAARVADAVAAAGGALPGARLDGLNLAEELADGDRIDVSGPGAGGGQEAEIVGDGLIDINRAGLAELETLPGVGPVLAQRIIDHRESQGRFDTVEDLLSVSGIGERKLESLRPHIRPP